MTVKFSLGQLVATRGIIAEMTESPAFAVYCFECLSRHSSGDWGDMDAEDKAENEFAMKQGNLRLFSSYEQPGLPKIWIITEADRSSTCTLFPEEY
jgi:hypothetical protein